MSIREDCKKIVAYFLEKAIDCGDLNIDTNAVTFSYNDLAEKLNLKSGKYCRVCCQYLSGHGYITTHSTEESNNIFCIRRSIRLSCNAIDFLESTSV